MTIRIATDNRIILHAPRRTLQQHGTGGWELVPTASYYSISRTCTHTKVTQTEPQCHRHARPEGESRTAGYQGTMRTQRTAARACC